MTIRCHVERIKVYKQSGSFHISCHYISAGNVLTMFLCLSRLTYFWLYTKVLSHNISSHLSGHECIDDKQEPDVMVWLTLNIFSGSFFFFGEIAFDGKKIFAFISFISDRMDFFPWMVR